MVVGMKKQKKHRLLVRQYQRGWFATIRRPLVKLDEIDTFCIDTTTYATKSEAIDTAQGYADLLNIELARPTVFKMPKPLHA